MSVTAVLVLLLCCWSLSLADDVAGLSDDVTLGDGDVVPNDDLATLLNRINTLERRVARDQDHLKSKLLRQESLIQELTTRLRLQESLNQEQTTKLRLQESLNQEQTTRLVRQDGMLLQQGRRIRQLRSAAASRASATASHDDVNDATGSKTPAPVSNSAVSGHNVAQLSDSGLNVTMRSDAAHNISKRSDDGGPLETVVNQISQRVTEQGAALQALKAQTSADVQTLQNSDRQQEIALQDARTSTFVRWGSSTCSASSSLVYSGVVGGSWYEHTGAATNFLCLTQSPVFSQHTVPSYVALLYGAEYDTQDSNQDKDPVCAVCRAAFSTTVMVPGTDTCSPGWHLDYSGFLMAGSHEHAAGSEFICVDSALQSAPHGDANDDGKLLYYTTTRCGSLPCGPYVNNKVVTCAVCSK